MIGRHQNITTVSWRKKGLSLDNRFKVSRDEKHFPFPMLGKEKETSLPFLCYPSRIVWLYFSSFRAEKTLPYEPLWLLTMVMCFPQAMKGNSCSRDICTCSDFSRFAMFNLCVVCSVHTGISDSAFVLAHWWSFDCLAWKREFNSMSLTVCLWYSKHM